MMEHLKKQIFLYLEKLLLEKMVAIHQEKM